MSHSVLAACTTRYGAGSLRSGIRSLWNPFFRAGNAPFPYRGLASIIDATRGPTDLTYILNDNKYDYPHEKDFDWMSRLQGVTHDSEHWYFSSQWQLYKLPVDHALEVEPDRLDSTGIPGELNQDGHGWDHMGDIDFNAHDGLLYVPVERAEPGSSVWTPWLVVYDTNLTCVGWAQVNVAHGNQAPWCAINPVNGLLYS